MERREELAEYIARMEFQAFDQVQNEGGRAECQDDFEVDHSCCECRNYGVTCAGNIKDFLRYSRHGYFIFTEDADTFF